MTRVHREFDCDVFMDPIDDSKFGLARFDFVSICRQVCFNCRLNASRDSRLPEGIQEENDLTFNVEVYEKIKWRQRDWLHRAKIVLKWKEIKS